MSLMNTTASISGFPIKLNKKDMSESIRLWIQRLVSGENPNKKYIFARIMHDDTVFFYTEEGESFYNIKMKLPAIMHFDKILVGFICDVDYQNKDSDLVELKVIIYANPKEDDKTTAELAKFRREMIQKFSL